MLPPDRAGAAAWHIGTLATMVVELVDGYDVAAAPVFVDLSGRRGRRVAWAGRALAALVIGYLVLLGAGMARAPWVPRLGLPGFGPLVVGNQRALPPVLPGAAASPIPTFAPSPPRASSNPTQPSAVASGAAGTVTSTPAGQGTAPGQNKTAGAGPSTATTATPAAPTVTTPTSFPATSTPRPGRGKGRPTTTNPHRP